MVFVDVLYVGAATVLVMVALHVLMYAVMRVAYPPEPRIIYRDVPVQQQQMPQQQPQPQHFPPPPPPPPVSFPAPIETKKVAFTEQKEEIQLPEYEARIIPSSSSLRLDAGLPDGLQETRPPGT